MAQADFTKALRDREEITITVKGRRSGRDIKLPVWFALEGKTLWLLPVQGSRTQWFRNVLADPTITLRAGRQALTAAGRPSRARSVVQSEEHTSELQSHVNLVCRLLLEKKKQ